MYLCPHAEDWLTLLFLPGLGCVLINRLVEERGTPSAALRSRSDQGGLTAARERARREIEQLERLRVSLYSWHCPQYPVLLLPFADRPVLLFSRGDITCLTPSAVAIIGSRTATDYGRRVASGLAADLAAQGLAVVSGAAFGVDAAAHRGAIRGQGRTAAVLGCGIDVVYPPAHADLYEEIAVAGVLLSEYPVGTRPEGFRFPVRNRIISGLACGVVVVEATEKSGSLITARLALDQGREVFAVPGRIDSLKSAGPHRLIQQGAHLVHSAGDILSELRWSVGVPSAGAEAAPVTAKVVLEAEEQLLLDHLEAYPRDIDSIVRQAGLPIVTVHTLLLRLELKGLVRQLPGQLYERREGP